MAEVAERGPRRRSARLGKALALCALLILPARGAAWQSDVHYGLTLFLAVEAGFLDYQAKEIACANLALDRDGRAAVPQMALILAGSERVALRAAERVRCDHFPAVAGLPAAPADRAVTPQPARPLKRVKEATSWKLLGEALHALQDSWSHRGEPDTPFRPFIRVRPDYAWSHPRTRGGWFRHLADLTDRRNKEVLAMAEVVYDLLRDSDLRPDDVKAPAWKKLERRVEELTSAWTKAAKRAWLKRHTDREEPDCDFSVPLGVYHERWALDLSDRGLNLSADASKLPEGDQELPEGDLPEIEWSDLNNTSWRGGIENLVDDTVEDDLAEFLRELLRLWLQEQKIPDVLAKVRFGLIRELLDLSYSTAGPEAWAQSYFTGWLVEDHGFVAGRGHFDPRLGEKALVKLSAKDDTEDNSKDDFKLIPEGAVKSYKNLLLPLGKDHLLMLSAAEEGTSDRLVLLRLRHAPNDLVILGVARDDKEEWIVNQLLWVAL